MKMFFLITCMSIYTLTICSEESKTQEITSHTQPTAPVGLLENAWALACFSYSGAVNDEAADLATSQPIAANLDIFKPVQEITDFSKPKSRAPFTIYLNDEPQEKASKIKQQLEDLKKEYKAVRNRTEKMQFALNQIMQQKNELKEKIAKLKKQLQ